MYNTTKHNWMQKHLKISKGVQKKHEIDTEAIIFVCTD